MTEQEARAAIDGFGGRLRALIERSGMTQKEAAERFGLAYNTVKYMVQGGRYPTLWSLIKIRDALGCTWDDLIGDGGGGRECRVSVVQPEMGGFHQYVCGTRMTQFRYRGDLNYCPVCGRVAHVR